MNYFCKFFFFYFDININIKIVLGNDIIFFKGKIINVGDFFDVMISYCLVFFVNFYNCILIFCYIIFIYYCFFYVKWCCYIFFR